jgi:hypothetical protein
MTADNKPLSAIVADALASELTLPALAAMPRERLQRLALDLAEVADRLDAVCALHGIALEEAV